MAVFVNVPFKKAFAWRWCIVAAAAATATVAAGLALDRPAPTELPETVAVARGDVVATLDVEGSVESARNVDITCKIKGGSTILWIVPDGSHVEKGDELVRFDSSGVEDLLSQQTIVVERARAAQITAEHELAAARLALPEYVEGTFVELEDEAALNIATAAHDLRLAQQNLAANRRLFRSGYISTGQVEASGFAVEQARLQLEIAHRARSVLETYNRPKMTQEIKTRLETAEALVRSSTAEFELAERQLNRYHAQLERCIVRAPHSGLAIYANNGDHWSGGPQIELGAAVRQRQAVIWLPDLAHMQVRALVHESSVLRVHPGQRATVQVRGRELPATITEVSNQPAYTYRSQAHIKYFIVVARIEQPSPGLRPGETAELSMLLDYRPNVLRAPLETVVKDDDRTLVWVESGESIEPRQIKLGACGDVMAEIRCGVKAGERIVIDPQHALPELGIPIDTESARRPNRFARKPKVAAAARIDRHGINAAGG